MATELTIVQNHSRLNRTQIEEAPVKYTYFDAALGKGDDSCMKTIKIAAAFFTLGGTLIIAGVFDLMNMHGLGSPNLLQKRTRSLLFQLM